MKWILCHRGKEYVMVCIVIKLFLDTASIIISATLTNIDKFDSGAFRVHSRMAATLDPQCRLMLEVGYLVNKAGNWFFTNSTLSIAKNCIHRYRRKQRLLL